MYRGEFKDDKRWGWGLMAFFDGDQYEGEWVDDIIDGKII